MKHIPDTITQISRIERRFGPLDARNINPNFDEYSHLRQQLSTSVPELGLERGQKTAIYIPRIIAPQAKTDMWPNSTRFQFEGILRGIRRVQCEGPIGGMVLSAMGAELPYVKIDDDNTEGHASQLFESILKSITTQDEREKMNTRRVQNVARPFMAPLP